MDDASFQKDWQMLQSSMDGRVDDIGVTIIIIIMRRRMYEMRSGSYSMAQRCYKWAIPVLRKILGER